MENTGRVIRQLRQEKGLTQKQLADRLQLSDKTVSKWERGQGLPDVSLLPALSQELGIQMEQLLSGALSPNRQNGGNMKQTRYFVCPQCQSLTFCTGNAQVSCCGRPLEALQPKKAAPEQKLTLEQIETDWYITADHPMQKDHYISFVALATGDRLQVAKQYPEWDLQVRFPRRGHGMLLWFDTKEGLMYQLL